MSTSLPSRILTILDVPEPAKFNADFFYNFFTADESVNDDQEISRKLLDKGNIQDLARIVPRFVRITYSPVSIQDDANNNEFISSEKNFGDFKNLILENIENIQSEQSFSNFFYTPVDLQDVDLGRNLYRLASGSLSFLSNDNKGSMLGMAKKLNSLTTDDISGDLISSFLGSSNNSTRGLSFINFDTNSDVDASEDIHKIALHSQINNKISYSLAKRSTEDSLNLFSETLESSLSVLRRIQSESATKSSAELNESDWESTLIPIKTRKIDSSEFKSSMNVIGYIIDKFEIFDDGSVEEKTPIVIGSPFVGSVIDPNVRYGATYAYGIRTIALVDVQAVDDDTDEIVAATSLLSSKRSPISDVSCVEFIPPPAPSDFDLRWDYRRKEIFLSWSFPPNRQRDIKRFQIFKRRTIIEPFKLVREYDFDDSEIKMPRGEFPTESLITKLDSPLTFYFDPTFKKDDVAIYTICSIDAHGLTSGYSEQFEVKFDRFKNKIVKRFISFADAPKSYPNLYINKDLFIDTIKTSGCDRVNIYFDPEVIDVVDSKGTSMNFMFSKASGGSYKFQFIDVGFQESQNFDVHVINERNIIKRRVQGRKLKKK